MTKNPRPTDTSWSWQGVPRCKRPCALRKSRRATIRKRRSAPASLCAVDRLKKRSRAAGAAPWHPPAACETPAACCMSSDTREREAGARRRPPPSPPPRTVSPLPFNTGRLQRATHKYDGQAPLARPQQEGPRPREPRALRSTGKAIPKDKAIKRFIVRNIVWAFSSMRDILRPPKRPQSTHRGSYCIEAAVHQRIVRSRSTDRRNRDRSASPQDARLRGAASTCVRRRAGRRCVERLWGLPPRTSNVSNRPCNERADTPAGAVRTYSKAGSMAAGAAKHRAAMRPVLVLSAE